MYHFHFKNSPDLRRSRRVDGPSIFWKVSAHLQWKVIDLWTWECHFEKFRVFPIFRPLAQAASCSFPCIQFIGVEYLVPEVNSRRDNRKSLSLSTVWVKNMPQIECANSQTAHMKSWSCRCLLLTYLDFISWQNLQCIFSLQNSVDYGYLDYDGCVGENQKSNDNVSAKLEKLTFEKFRDFLSRAFFGFFHWNLCMKMKNMRSEKKRKFSISKFLIS